MGIGSTVKNMLGNDGNEAEDRVNTDRASSSYDTDLKETNRHSLSGRQSKLPAGTGPGTTGKPAAGTIHSTELAMRQDAERAKTQGATGYGTDAAAATGGSLSGTHQAKTRTSQLGSQSGTRTEGVSPATTSTRTTVNPTREHETDFSSRNLDSDYRDSRINSDREEISYGERTEYRDLEGRGRSGSITHSHAHGHTKTGAKDAMPSGNAEEDTVQLEPVTRERVRHIETEEVARVMERERHVHHIQHHTQPIIAAEELAEEHREQIHPVTVIKEIHANKVEDNTLFEGQVHQFRDTLSHTAKERTVIDKGTTVNEIVHHHVHHVIQPIIEKETIEKKRIHTTIPIKEVTNEAPVVHQSQTHAPVPIEHFLQRGGTLEGAVSQDEITKRVLHTGECYREVNGIAETLERDLNLGKATGVQETMTTKGKEVPSKKFSAGQVEQPRVPVSSKN